jgi:hypothetical protein
MGTDPWFSGIFKPDSGAEPLFDYSLDVWRRSGRLQSAEKLASPQENG